MIVIVEENQKGAFLTTSEMDAEWMILINTTTSNIRVRSRDGTYYAVSSLDEGYKKITQLITDASAPVKRG